MKAFALSSFDQPAAVIEVPDPIVQADEVLVRVRAAALDPYDAFVASGAVQQYMPYEFPAVLGGDLAGTVEALGDGVDGFAAGDRVFGMMGMKAAVHDGSFGELAVPQAASIASTPDGVSDIDASTLGVAGATATRGAAQGQEIDGVATASANGNPARLPELAGLVADGKVRVTVTRTYRLDDATQALRDLTEQHTVGKLVITVV